jgi:hypothetical protein
MATRADAGGEFQSVQISSIKASEIDKKETYVMSQSRPRVAAVLQYCLTFNAWRLEDLFFEDRVKKRHDGIIEHHINHGAIYGQIRKVHSRPEMKSVLDKAIAAAKKHYANFIINNEHHYPGCSPALDPDMATGVCWEPVSPSLIAGEINPVSGEEIFIYAGERHATSGIMSSHVCLNKMNINPHSQAESFLRLVAHILGVGVGADQDECDLGWVLMTGVLENE